INLTDNNFEDLIPVAVRQLKKSQKYDELKSIFQVSSNGISTNRDEWVYDFDLSNLAAKAKFFIEEYNSEVNRWIEYKELNSYKDIRKESNPVVDKFLEEINLIKWSKMIKRDKLRKEKLGEFKSSKIIQASYRPYSLQYLYLDYIPIDLPGQQLNFFPDESLENHTDYKNTNIVISFSGLSFSKPFQTLATNYVSSLDFLEKTVCVSLYYYDENGNRNENITDWSLQKFQTHYNNKKIKKLDIFHYTYAVLHNPTYRQKYEQNLKREFPRLPFYENFQQWVKWGKKLIDLHINYETIKPYPLTRIDLPSTDNQPTPKPKLKADKTKDKILIDTFTTLEKIPKIAWEYRLGNRSALEWVLDQYKEKKPRDKTIAEKFNTYSFADYKETVIDLLQKVCAVSVETMKIIQKMETIENHK
ncbi:MAG: DNA methyltransferase, partial [Okeania sp. SIO2D1]|nr:DNA methyltransferase [Okeania sp. SIO2D1]